MARAVVIPADPAVAVEDWNINSYQDCFGVVMDIEETDIEEIGVTVLSDENAFNNRLRFNPRATQMWWDAEPDVRHYGLILGDVIVVGLTDDGGPTDIPPHVAQALRQRRGDDGILFRP